MCRGASRRSAISGSRCSRSAAASISAPTFRFTIGIVTMSRGVVVLLMAALSMNTIAERYVKLVLAVGQHDADFVDAFYGPDEWKTEAKRQTMPLLEIQAAATLLIAEIPAVSEADRRDELVVLRHDYLKRQLDALLARVRMLQGAKL